MSIEDKDWTKFQGRHWVATINNYTDIHVTDLKLKVEPHAEYLVYGYEVGESGTPHLQLYVCFKVKKRFSAVKKMMPTAHLEGKLGTNKSASDYCKKGAQPHDEWKAFGVTGPNFGRDARFTEIGTLPPEQQAKGGEALEKMWDAARESSKRGDFDSIPSSIYMRHDMACHRIHERSMASKPLKTLTWERVQYGGKPPNIWLYGPAGTGKTTMAEEIANHTWYEKPNNTFWWTDYKYEDSVLWNDVGRAGELGTITSSDVKTWLDTRPFHARIHGQQKRIRPERIIMTSNHPPSDVFRNKRDLAAIEDRMQVFHIEDPGWWKFPDDDERKMKYRKIIDDNKVTEVKTEVIDLY